MPTLLGHVAGLKQASLGQFPSSPIGLSQLRWAFFIHAFFFSSHVAPFCSDVPVPKRGARF